MMGEVGVVVALSRYPVKSMRADPLQAAELHWTWLHGDRQYAFLKSDDTSGFPWLTARDVPAMLLHSARYLLPEDPKQSRVTVTAPDGRAFDIRDPALAASLAEQAGRPVSLLRLGRGGFDAMPVSVLATTMVEEIGRVHGMPLAVGRFRANLVIRPDDPAVTEQDWLGRTLHFQSGAEVDLGWATPRCAMVGIDPETAERDATVVRTVVRRFGNAVGAYGGVRRPGPIALGDRVTLSSG